MSVWWSGKEQSEHNSIRNQGTGQNDQNKGNGQGSVEAATSTGHKLLDQLNRLKAEGKGNTTQAKELERYMSGVEQKYQSEGRSLYPDPSPLEQEALAKQQQDWESKTELERIQQLASLEAGQEKYAKSWEGKEFIRKNKEKGFTEEEILGSPAWRDQFGMPSIVTTASRTGAPIMTGERTDEYGQKISPQYIYSGLGKTLMDQYGKPGFDYGTAKDAYWDERTVQDQAGTDQSAMATWPSDGGGGGGGGGGYGPQPGYKPEQMVNFYTPQANLQQAMVNVHQTPTVFKKRGGIVSLLELR